jgi:RNA ligase (TIGR02306 family)
MSGNPLATVEDITEVRHHSNADRLDIVKVGEYTAIVSRDSVKVGTTVFFIHPDAVLPTDLEWADAYRAYCPRRVKAAKLRGEWSFGIVVPIEIDGLCPVALKMLTPEGVADFLGVTKYEAPAPQDPDAIGGLPFGLPKTDETRYQSVRDIPYGCTCNVTVKIDGQSSTYYCKKVGDDFVTGICSRSMEVNKESNSRLARMDREYGILKSLEAYCRIHNRQLALRGEIYGDHVQNFKHNPHAELPLGWACFSVFDFDTMSYVSPGSEVYYYPLCEHLELPRVEILEKGVQLTKELLEKYRDNPKFEFEGVVINAPGCTFKVINLHYDSKK